MGCDRPLRLKASLAFFVGETVDLRLEAVPSCGLLLEPQGELADLLQRSRKGIEKGDRERGLRKGIDS